MIKIICLALLFNVCVVLRAAASEYAVDLTVDAGFYQRENEIATLEIDFGVPAGSLLLTDERGEEVPFYFIPKKEYSGELQWKIEGIIEPLSTRDFTLVFKEDKWSPEPFGDVATGELARRRLNMIVNPSFVIVEEEDEQEISPVGWELTENAEISGAEAYKGDKSLKITGVMHEEDGDTSVTGGRASARQLIMLDGGEKYSLSISLKITERFDTGERAQAVIAEVRFLDSDEKRVSSDPWRIFVPYSTTGHPEEDYLGKWITVEREGVAPADTVYGQVRIYSFLFAGTVYCDNLVFREAVTGEPVSVEAGGIRRLK